MCWGKNTIIQAGFKKACTFYIYINYIEPYKIYHSNHNNNYKTHVGLLFMVLLHAKRINMLSWKCRRLISLTLTLSPVLGYMWPRKVNLCPFVHSLQHITPTNQTKCASTKPFFPERTRSPQNEYFVIIYLASCHSYPSYYVLTPMRFEPYKNVLLVTMIIIIRHVGLLFVQ